MTTVDTNGYHPRLLETILSQGLADYVAMDVKNSPAKYAVTAGLETLDLAPVYESIRILKDFGESASTRDISQAAFDYEFRTTVVKELHEASDFYEIGEIVRGASQHYLQCFTDRDSVPFAGFSAPVAEDLKTYAAILTPYVKKVEIRGVE